MTMEKILRIPIADLGLLRITCKKCGGSSELTMGQVSKRVRGTDCPFCNVQLFASDRPTAAANFANAVAEILKEDEHVLIELVVPATDG